MNNIYENISALCLKHGISGGRLCEDIGISKSTLTELKKGRQKGLSASVAQKIADYFGVTVADLLHNDVQSQEIPSNNAIDICKPCDLYLRILELCHKKGVTGGKLATDIGISKGLLTDLKMGRRTGVSASTASKIANYFGVSVQSLLGQDVPLSNCAIESIAYNQYVEAKDRYLMIALFGEERPKEDLDEVLRFAEYIKSRK